MSLVNVGVTAYPDTARDFNWSNSGGTQTFDAATDTLACIFQVPATGTIANVHYWISSVSSPVLTLRIEMRTVDATTGKPNAAGTLYGSSTSITVSNPTAGAKTAAVNCTGATVGDVVAVVFDLSAYTSGSFAWRLSARGPPGLGASTIMFPYQVTNTTGSDVIGALALNCLALEYSASPFYSSINGIDFIVGTGIATTIKTNGTPYVGNIFIPPVPMRAVGIWVGTDHADNVLLRLYSSTGAGANGSLLATATVDKDLSSGARIGQYLFDAAVPTVNLTAGAHYVATIEATSTNAVLVWGVNAIPQQAQLDQMAGGQHCFYDDAHGGGSLTTRYGIGILYDQLWCPDNVSGLHPIDDGIAA